MWSNLNKNVSIETPKISTDKVQIPLKAVKLRLGHKNWSKQRDLAQHGVLERNSC